MSADIQLVQRTLRAAWEVLKKALIAWIDDDAPTLGAALAFYAVFSVAPLLIIAITISGLVFGEDAARGQIVGEIQGIVGKEGGEAIQSMLRHASQPGEGLGPAIIGLALLLFGASAVFVQLQSSLNVIWRVPPVPGRGWVMLVKRRFLSYAMTLGVGFLLMVSLVLTAWLAALGDFFSQSIPGRDVLGEISYVVVSFGVITLLFAMIFKILPDAVIAWRDVWAGAAITALLFTLGKKVIGLYLARHAVGSAYGAAGSFAVLLLWVFYSSQVAFLGAEITHAYAEMLGSRCVEGTDNEAPTNT